MFSRLISSSRPIRRQSVATGPLRFGPNLLNVTVFLIPSLRAYMAGGHIDANRRHLVPVPVRINRPRNPSR